VRTYLLRLKKARCEVDLIKNSRSAGVRAEGCESSSWQKREKFLMPFLLSRASFFSEMTAIEIAALFD